MSPLLTPMSRFGHLRRPSQLAAVAALLPVATGCARGRQTLYVMNDASTPVTIVVDGRAQPRPCAGLCAFRELNLERGAVVRSLPNGSEPELERVTLPPVARYDSALYLVRGTPELHLVPPPPRRRRVPRRRSAKRPRARRLPV